MGDFKAALISIYGANANYLEGQEDFLRLILENQNSNIHGTIPCGRGKSLTFFLLAKAAILSGVNDGVSFVVLPYKFLVDHMVQVGERMGLETVAVQCSNIAKGATPSPLVENIPTIVFFTVDSFAKMMSDNGGKLEQWCDEGILRRIFLDEIHLPFIEVGFRRSYDCFPQIVPKFVSKGIQVITMSGSLSIGVEAATQKWLGTKNCKSRRTASLGLAGIPIHVKPIPTGDGLQSVIQDRLKFGHIHVFCWTKRDCAKIYDCLLEIVTLNQIGVVTSDTSEEARQGASKTWFNGGWKILISTTCCLVGNENLNCKTVICFGHMYNLASLIQAMGRLRVNQRNGCKAICFLDVDKEVDAASDLMAHLSCCGLLSDAVRKFVGPTSLNNFYRTSECRIALATKEFGARLVPNCGECDNCVTTRIQERKVNMNCDAQQKHEAEVEINREFSSLRDKMDAACVVCERVSCKGEDCMTGRCHICGIEGHNTKECTMRNCKPKDSLEGRACRNCWTFGPDHSSYKCKHRRWKRLVLYNGSPRQIKQLYMPTEVESKHNMVQIYKKLLEKPWPAKRKTTHPIATPTQKRRMEVENVPEIGIWNDIACRVPTTASKSVTNFTILKSPSPCTVFRLKGSEFNIHHPKAPLYIPYRKRKGEGLAFSFKVVSSVVFDGQIKKGHSPFLIFYCFSLEPLFNLLFLTDEKKRGIAPFVFSIAFCLST
ncbi:unnamed protein product [Cylindrotheca closterium]|uniref:DNA 3'-5' helicase n=1 Tax=Cylindrotheca closterium TaxID=2856 RepID=A0AAD2G641_9STRA|nr:unnamed protein product [Cylindrotheca closterium]